MIENSNLKLEHAEILNSGDGLNWYAYANNNPLRFVDPTGLKVRNPNDGIDDKVRMTPLTGNLGNSKYSVSEYGCSFIATARAAFDTAGKDFSASDAQSYANNKKYFDSETGDVNRNLLYKDISGKNGDWQSVEDTNDVLNKSKDILNSDDDFLVTARVKLEISTGKVEHEVTVNSFTENDDGTMSFEWTATSSNDEGRAYTMNGTGNVNDVIELRYQEVETTNE